MSRQKWTWQQSKNAATSMLLKHFFDEVEHIADFWNIFGSTESWVSNFKSTRLDKARSFKPLLTKLRLFRSRWSWSLFFDWINSLGLPKILKSFVQVHLNSTKYLLTTLLNKIKEKWLQSGVCPNTCQTQSTSLLWFVPINGEPRPLAGDTGPRW